MKYYSASVAPVTDGVLVKVSFGEPAQNDVIVPDAVASIKALNLVGGRTAFVNGPASLPVAFAIGHELCHLFTEVACFDPKVNGYIVATSHGGRPVGTLIPTAMVV